jgi:hypothetical protein
MCSLTTEAVGNFVVNIPASGVVMTFMYAPLARKILVYFEEVKILIAASDRSFMVASQKPNKDLSQQNLEVTVFAT